uniref:Queuosine 5'-phosphate N-glycosylase/hydrolase n=1 Tax=Ganoderma boninense TaxID=34458 RepID=A0A5K1K4Q2_9APHY|nr:Cytochrome P450 monooxygenase AKT7 (EC (AK-toxin biosynthesis protein 7) [Ganoderma boninense]
MKDFDGSFYGFIQAFRLRYNDRGTALQLVKMVAETFPPFRDEYVLNGRRGKSSPIHSLTPSSADPFLAVCIWKRAQILVAETWAAFYPEDSSASHPLFPTGPAIHELTMFADYRVPQILHHLRMLTYPPALVKLLEARTPLPSGSREELSIRVASIVAVERVRREIALLIADEEKGDSGRAGEDAVSSVMIDFYLWDLAKLVEGREGGVEGVDAGQTFDRLIHLYPEYGTVSYEAPSTCGPTSPPSVSSLRIPIDPTGTRFPWKQAGVVPVCDQDGSAVFLGLAEFMHGLHPCKIRVEGAGRPLPFVSYDGKEHEHRGATYLLPFDPARMQWVQTSAGQIPRGARPVEGGYERIDRERLYHARAVVNGVTVPGKAGELGHLGGANVPFGGREHLIAAPYEVL